MITQQKLNWSQFLEAVASFEQEAFGMCELKALVQRLEIGPDFVESRIQFSEETYTRNLIFKNERFEALCLCWQGEQQSTIHNHGDSFGIVVVYAGAMREEIFRCTGDGKLVANHDHVIGPGRMAIAPVGMIHRLSNAGGHESSLVSIHFYAKPLVEMEVFIPEAAGVQRKPMLVTR